MKTQATTNAYDGMDTPEQAQTWIKSVAPYLIWPVLLLLNGSLVVTLLEIGLNTGLALTLGIFSIVFTMLSAEYLLPYRQEWQPTGKEWFTNSIYFMINGAVSNLGTITAAIIVSQLATGTSELPLFTAIIVAILLSEFVGYWWHRLGHEVEWIWRFHSIHHVPNKVNLANNNTVHFVDLFTNSLLSACPAILIGLPAEAIAIAMFFASFQSFFAHINANAKLGWLGYLVMGPEHHRYHHSVKTHEALNYSVTISLWDYVFASFLYHPNTAPEKVGVKNAEDYPASTEIIKTILKPFK